MRLCNQGHGRGCHRGRVIVIFVKWGGVKPAHPDLYRVRGALANALRIEGTPITTNDGDRGMLGQPGRDTSGRAVRQQVYDPMLARSARRVP